MAGDLEWSIHPPTPFIRNHWMAILPQWVTPVQSVLVVLLRSPMPLMAHDPAIEVSKDSLRDRILSLTQPLVLHLQTRCHAVAVFDPRTGLPHDGQKAGMPLDDVAVVKATLGYCTQSWQHCHCTLHPTWGSAVYPGIVLSDALPAELSAIAQTCLSY